MFFAGPPRLRRQIDGRADGVPVGRRSGRAAADRRPVLRPTASRSTRSSTARAARSTAPPGRDWRDWACSALLLPEAAGGGGLGVVEAAIVFEQLGSPPGARAGAVDRARRAVRRRGRRRRAARRRRRPPTPWSTGPPSSSTPPRSTCCWCVGDDDLVAHQTADLAPPTPLDPLDPLTPVGRFTGLGDGELVGDADGRRRPPGARHRARARRCSPASPRGRSTWRATTRSEREQFGVPIGSFQAVKHLLADMYVRTVCAQSATYAAAAVLDDPGDDDPARVAASAKLLAADAAIENASTAVQVLGGMGFTWDMLPNYLLKRAWALEHDFGTAEDHAAPRGLDARGGGLVSDATEPADAGVVVEADDGVLHLVIDRPDRKGSLRVAEQRPRSSRRSRTAATDDSLRVVLIRSAGDDFCTGADWVAANRGGGPKPRPGSLQRRTPVQAHRLIAADPGDPAARWCAPCAAGPPASAARSPWPRTSSSPPRPPSSGCRSPSGASRPTAVRPGCCPGSSAWRGPRRCSCWAGRSPAATPPTGG